MSVPRVLAVAGSDAGGGAGIQADIKTITALGGHAMTAITAVTAQNTLGVTDIVALPPASVIAQIKAVASDIGVDAIKIGMLGTAATAAVVATWLFEQYADRAIAPMVFDPVMVATSGARLADADTVVAFERLMGLSVLVTPNLPELAALAGIGEGELADPSALVAAAAMIARRTGAAVLVKGGHAAGDVLIDRLIEADGSGREWRGPRIDTRHTHGTGCTLSSAIAAGLAAGLPLAEAIGRARAFVRAALHAAPGLGGGHGPMGHGLVATGWQDDS